MISLLTQLFSIKKGSMRAIRLHRVVQVVWLLPLFVFLLITNNIALALDWVLFQVLKNKKLKTPFLLPLYQEQVLLTYFIVYLAINLSLPR